jgi:threonine/homoserine/homoserine lactone efflux protein
MRVLGAAYVQVLGAVYLQFINWQQLCSDEGAQCVEEERGAEEKGREGGEERRLVVIRASHCPH